ncbi:unnamed protein product [Linum trigynum]|uniref:CHCH domain-containing protein n=1 Tax=Linum trigynum TaxID=586398 RepID=A0AAV2FDJ9_9ROSI
MARGRGGSSGKASRSRSRSPPPQKAAAAPPLAPMQSRSQNEPIARGGLGAAVADGLAWGTGTAVAHRAVDAVLGPRTIKHESSAASSEPTAAMQAAAATPNSTINSSCDAQSKALQDCLNMFGTDIGKCQFYMDMLGECRRSASGAGMAA